ncbi:hypothetical protein NC652_041347 [Populus alba x Populus x berolinensis]|nr:hypothetical protein NC652_041347 [Populus alba x Populus x berolinensis]
MHQAPTFFSQRSCPLRDNKHHPSTNPQGDLGLIKGPRKKVTLQLPGLWPWP